MREITVRDVQLDQLEPGLQRTLRCVDERVLDFLDLRSRKRLGVRESFEGYRSGPTGCQPPCSSGDDAVTFPRRIVDALRPACASWIAGTAPCALMNRAIRASGSMCLSSQMPMSSGEIRPRASTAVASTITMPAPPTAREPRCTRCQSFASHRRTNTGTSAKCRCDCGR